MQKLSDLMGDWANAKHGSLLWLAAHPEECDRYLAERGYVLDRPRDYTANGYCPYNKCGGAGFLRFEVPYGNPLFGKVVPCECKKDEAMQTSESKLEEYKKQLGRTGQSYTLRNWIGSDQEALAAAQEAVDQPFGIHVFVGPYGTGKSGLLSAIVNSALERRLNASYMVVDRMLSKLQAAHTAGLDGFEKAFAELCNVRVLALDEFSAYKHTETKEQVLRSLIEERYRHWDRLLTVIGTNELPEEGAILSRFNDQRTSKIVLVGGKDLRPLAADLSDEADFWWTHELADTLGHEADERYAVVS